MLNKLKKSDPVSSIGYSGIEGILFEVYRIWYPTRVYDYKCTLFSQYFRYLVDRFSPNLGIMVSDAKRYQFLGYPSLLVRAS